MCKYVHAHINHIIIAPTQEVFSDDEDEGAATEGAVNAVTGAVAPLADGAVAPLPESRQPGHVSVPLGRLRVGDGASPARASAARAL